jgi:hypothetical protein
MDATRQMLSIQAVPDINNIRTAELFDQEHTVIPCVALCEGVLWPANAPAPELALAEEFGRFPDGWNGRPVVYDHPKDADGLAISASSPEVLEVNAFGQIFGTTLEDKKLKLEIWINRSRVASMPEEAREVIAELESGEGMVEVSTGLYTMSEMVEGTYNGQKYSAVWRNIVPDHLAVLPKGIKGACSVKDGCGAPRTNEGQMEPVMKAEQLHISTSSNTIIQTDESCECEDVTPEEKSFLKSILAGVRSLASSGSDDEPETPIVPADPVEDEPTTNQEIAMNEVVNELIANERTQFTEDDREWLSSLDEDTLTKLAPVDNSEAEEAVSVEESTEMVTEDTAEVEEAPAVNNQAPAVTTEEYIASAPAEIREHLEAGLKLHRARRNALIDGLKANARCKFTEDQLRAKSIDELEVLIELAAVDVDYSGNGPTANADASRDDDTPPEPPKIFTRNADAA